MRIHYKLCTFFLFFFLHFGLFSLAFPEKFVQSKWWWHFGIIDTVYPANARTFVWLHQFIIAQSAAGFEFCVQNQANNCAVSSFFRISRQLKINVKKTGHEKKNPKIFQLVNNVLSLALLLRVYFCVRVKCERHCEALRVWLWQLGQGKMLKNVITHNQMKMKYVPKCHYPVNYCETSVWPMI